MQEIKKKKLQSKYTKARMKKERKHSRQNIFHKNNLSIHDHRNLHSNSSHKIRNLKMKHQTYLIYKSPLHIDSSKT